MDEDEDIILQNSPLDTYLQQVTDNDFSRYENVKESLLGELNQYPDASEAATTPNTSSTGNFLGQTHLFLPGLFSTNTNKIDVINLCNELFLSNLLNDEDLCILLDLKEEVLARVGIDQKVQENSSAAPSINDQLLYVAVIVLIASVILQVLCNSSLAFYAFVVAILCVALIWWLVKNKESVLSEQRITKFVTNFHQVDKLLDQSIIHIKEVEIINTGIQMFRNSVTGGGKIPGKNVRKCLKLRSVAFDLLIDLFMELRVNERILLHSYADELFSMKEEFLASIPLAQFNEVLSNEKPHDDLQLADISLEKLKALVYIFRALLSEFTLTLIVCFYSSSTDNSNFTDMLHATEQVTLVANKHLRGLQQSLDKSMKMTFNRKDMTPIHQHTRNKEDLVERYFKKCKLNIYSSLSRMEEAELLINNESGSFDMASMEHLVLQFYLNLDNAKACLEDVLDHVKPTDSRKPKNDENGETEQEPTADLDIQTVIPEREMGDLLFEGESLKAPHKPDEEISADYYEQRLKESRESKRLLRELKSIFAVKDSPAGLLSFPLTKLEDEQCPRIEPENEDDENMLAVRKKRIITAVKYEDFYGEGEEDAELRNYLPTAPIGVPMNLLQGLTAFSSSQHQEEKFGSSDDDDDDE